MTADRHDERREESPQERELRRRLRDAALGGRPDDAFKRDLRTGLEHNFRHHRPHRMRTMIAAAAVVAAALISTRIVDVGGDSFDLVDTGRVATRDDGTRIPIFVAPFDGENAAGTMVRGDSVVVADKEYLERVKEAKAAGLDKVTGVFGWQLPGVTKMDLKLDVQLGDRIVKATDPLISPDDAGRREIIRFYRTAFTSFMAAIDSGLVPVSGTEIMVVKGRRVLVTRWTREVEGFGPVTYLDGEVIDDQP